MNTNADTKSISFYIWQITTCDEMNECKVTLEVIFLEIKFVISKHGILPYFSNPN